MSGIKMALMASTAGLSGLAAADPLTVGGTLGNSTPSVILGVVAVACVWALVRLYRDRQADVEMSRRAHDEHTSRLYALIEASTKASTAAADVHGTVAALMVEVKDALLECRVRQEATNMQPAHAPHGATRQ
jgi:hypothetical protein